LEDDMSTTAPPEQRVHADGIEIHYLGQGEGEPLVLLHDGLVSTNPIWTGVPVAYAGHMDELAEHFRVIFPAKATTSHRPLSGRPSSSSSAASRRELDSNRERR
jgi:hypothetical protein